MLDTLAAVALSSPSNSDLQQRDILIVEDAVIRAREREEHPKLLRSIRRSRHPSLLAFLTSPWTTSTPYRRIV